MKENGPKKTLYHSELQQLSPVTVTVQGLRKSQYKGKDYFRLLVEGNERNYIPDSVQCSDFLGAYQGKEIRIIAEGYRETATLRHEQPPVQTAKPAAQPARTAPAAQPAQPELSTANSEADRLSAEVETENKKFQTPHEATQTAKKAAAQGSERDWENNILQVRKRAAQLVNLALISYSATRNLKERIQEQFGETLTESQFSGFNMNFMIELERGGAANQLPVKPIEKNTNGNE